MSSHPLFWRHHTYSVRYHWCHMYAIIWVIQDMISTLYDNLYYKWHHMHYIHSITRVIYDNSCTPYDVTFTICVTSHNDPIYGIKHYMFMLYSLDMASGSVMTTKPLCAFSATMPDITLNVFLTLHTMFQFLEKKWVYVITDSICMTPYAIHMTSHPLFMTSHHWSYHITSTARMTSNTQYMT